MKKKPKTTYKALRNKLLLITLTMWFLSMFLLTWTVGADFYYQLKGNTSEWAEYVKGWQSETEYSQDKITYYALNRLMYCYLPFRTETLLPFIKPQSSGYGSYANNETGYGFQAAMAYYDKEGNMLFRSGDCLYFSCYYYEDGQRISTYAYIDLEALSGGKELADKYISNNPLGDFSPFLGYDIKMRGYFEGCRFYPVAIYTNQQVYYDVPAPNKQLVSISLSQTEGYDYEPGPGFLCGGKYYENVRDLLQEDTEESTFGLFGAVIRDKTYIHSNGMPGFPYKAKLVIYCNPMEYAALRLYWVYAISLEVVLIVVFRMLRRIRREISEPLMVMVRGYEQNRAELSPFGRSPLADLKLLGEHFDYAQQERHRAENEVQQLRTALNYAQNAEESRRKMVSAIAHELKTPLAVIHSYAEGLQEGIAPEKQEKYLSVILSEAQQMDALVQQMLDLSRLEAGKITLNTDQVDLAKLTREILEKLSLAAEARQLQVEMDLAELSVVADEARISQVITNFASNAVKYTTQGGTIRVRLQREDKYAKFSVENNAPHFSDEALEQVWETFYRADTARDRSGTGLGLAIARNIIELHRGSCRVRNTQKGVEFSFRIPI